MGQGTKGQEYNSDNTLTVTLTNGKFNTISASKDGSMIAVEGLPAGLEYEVNATEDTTEATITITGTPSEVASDKALTIRIKKESLKEQTGVGSEFNPTGDVRITVVDSPVSATTAEVSGTLGNGTFGEEYPSSQNTLTVTLSDGTFNTITDSKDDSMIAVENLPSGLEYSVAATDGEATATITISGTPTATASNQDLTIKIKEAALKDKNGVSGEITATGTAQITVEAKEIAINDLTANGESGVTTTTELTLTLAKDIDLVKGDVTLTGATLDSVKDNDNGTYTLTISSITVDDGGDVSVELAKDGYTFTDNPKTVVVHKGA